MKKVAIIMGSDSDMPVVSKAADTLKALGIPYTMRVLSAHRTPEQVRVFGKFNGLDALLSTVQMPSGIPVATVAVDGAVNAALLAAQMIALSDDELAAKLDAKRRADAEKVLAKDAALNA